MKRDFFPLLSIVIVMWFGHMLVDFMIGIWAVYKTLAGLDIAIAGLIAGASALIGESLQCYFGSLSDKGYRQHLIVFGLMTTLVSSLMAYTDNYFFLFLLFLFTCLGSGAFHPAAVSVMNELSEKRKAFLITIFQSGGALGLAFSQLIFSRAFYVLEGHTLYLAIPGALLGIFVACKGWGASPPKEDQAPPTSSWKTFGRFFKSPELVHLYITQLSNQAVFWATVFVLPDILLNRGYDDWICFGGAHLFLILGGAIMMVPAGYLADKYGCKGVIFSAKIIGTAGLYYFLQADDLSPAQLCSVLFVLGAALGTVSPVVIALGNRYSPANSGMISAFLMGLVWCLAEGIGQGGVGLLTKLFTENAAAYSLACLGTLLFIGMASTLRLPNSETVLHLEIA